jgi:hypothetical protein
VPQGALHIGVVQDFLFLILIRFLVLCLSLAVGCIKLDAPV